MSELRQIKPIGDRAHALAKLIEHESWKVLIAEYEEVKERHLKRLAGLMLAGAEDAAPIDQRRVDYRRGYLRGAADILRSPENAIRELEKELEREERQK